MDIVVKGRHTDVNERFRRQAGAKLGKIEKLDHKVIRVDVEVSKEHNPRQSDRRERVELTIRSRGPVIRAEAAAVDRYAALDIAMSKLESRLRRMNDRRKVHHGNHAPARLSTAATVPEPLDTAPGNGTRPRTGGSRKAGGTAKGARTTPAAAGTAETRDDPAAAPGRGGPGGTPNGAAPATARTGDEAETIVPIPMEGDGPLVVREKRHHAKPMAIDQALHEMELVGHDFYLFRDAGSGDPCVVYRRRGWDYGVIRLVEE